MTCPDGSLEPRLCRRPRLLRGNPPESARPQETLVLGIRKMGCGGSQRETVHSRRDSARRRRTGGKRAAGRIPLLRHVPTAGAGKGRDPLALIRRLAVWCESCEALAILPCRGGLLTLRAADVAGREPGSGAHPVYCVAPPGRPRHPARRHPGGLRGLTRPDLLLGTCTAVSGRGRAPARFHQLRAPSRFVSQPFQLPGGASPGSPRGMRSPVFCAEYRTALGRRPG